MLLSLRWRTCKLAGKCHSSFNSGCFSSFVLSSVAQSTLWRRSVYITTFFLGSLSPLSDYPDTDNCLPWISGIERMTVENSLWSILPNMARIKLTSLPRWLSWLRSDLWSGGCGFDPRRSATFCCRDWSWSIFYGHSLPFADWRRAVVNFWQKNVHNTG